MAEEGKAASEGSEASVEVEEVVEITEETTVEEEESVASASKKKKPPKKKKPAKKKKQPAAPAAPAKKKKKKKAKSGSVVWAYPRKPAVAPSYSPCPHRYFKHSIIDRNKLNHQKYTDLLATPKSEPWKEPEDELQKFRRRPITPRTECLALPQKRKMQAQLVEFHNILTPQMIENLGILLGTNCDLTAEPVVLYPNGTSPETSEFLRNWARWLYQSLCKVSLWAEWLQQVLSEAEIKVAKQQADKKAKGRKPKKPKEDPWLAMAEDVKVKIEDWHSTKKDIVNTGKKWDKFMKTRPDKK